MDEDLKLYLRAMEERMVDIVVARVADPVVGRLDVLENRMKAPIKDAFAHTETNIIKEFHKWGRSSGIKTRQALTDTSLLSQRLLSVEDRVSDLERRSRGLS